MTKNTQAPTTTCKEIVIIFNNQKIRDEIVI
jgi:hypothetical protein